MIRALLLVSSLTAVLCAAPAAAQTQTSTTFTGVREANNPMVNELAALAVQEWHRPDGCPVDLLLADRITAVIDDQEIDGDGAATACTDGHAQMWLRTELVAQAQREHARPGVGGDSWREELCVTVMHEYGHTFGLPHSDHGVMSPLASTTPACTRWRKTLDRNRHVHAHQARMAARRRAHRRRAGHHHRSSR